MSGQETFVIVGAGLAGAKAAESLREEGFEGRLILIGEEPERPYERPPLSKDYLRGETAERPYVHAGSFYAEQEIELRPSTQITGVDAERRQVVAADGPPLDYDRLLLTTGAAPRRLDVPGAGLEGIHYLRTVADSERLGSLLQPGKRVVVVGSGWIGSEVAVSARQKGCEVTMIEIAALPLERVLGPELGRVYLDLHRDHGVEFIAGATVESFGGRGSVERIVTAGGASIEADLVVVGVGVTPNTGLGEAAGLRVDNGILVDEGLRTGDPAIFAAGDVASAFHPFYSRHLRVEHWANAIKQGPVAARAMLGKAASYEEIPYFFSDQYETGMEYSGFATEWDQVVFRGDVGARELVAFWLKDRRLVAGLNMNVWDVSDPIRDLIQSRRELSPDDLADSDVSISDLLGSAASAGEALGAAAPE